MTSGLPSGVTIVEAVMLSANHGGRKSMLAAHVEKAMATAVLQARSDGVVDVVEMKKRIDLAIASAVDEYDQKQKGV